MPFVTSNPLPGPGPRDAAPPARVGGTSSAGPPFDEILDRATHRETEPVPVASGPEEARGPATDSVPPGESTDRAAPPDDAASRRDPNSPSKADAFNDVADDSSSKQVEEDKAEAISDDVELSDEAQHEADQEVEATVAAVAGVADAAQNEPILPAGADAARADTSSSDGSSEEDARASDHAVGRVSRTEKRHPGGAVHTKPAARPQRNQAIETASTTDATPATEFDPAADLHVATEVPQARTPSKRFDSESRPRRSKKEGVQPVDIKTDDVAKDVPSAALPGRIAEPFSGILDPIAESPGIEPPRPTTTGRERIAEGTATTTPAATTSQRPALPLAGEARVESQPPPVNLTAAPWGAAERSRFVHRVAGALQAAGAGEPILLRLHPPELGALRVEVILREGSLAARLEAETSSARSLLLDHVGSLRERLADQGIRMDRFDVELSQRRSDDTGGGDSRASHAGDKARRDGRRGTRREVPAIDISGALGRRVLPGSDQLDVLV